MMLFFLPDAPLETLLVDQDEPNCPLHTIFIVVASQPLDTRLFESLVPWTTELDSRGPLPWHLPCISSILHL